MSRAERRRAEGPRLALAMADAAACLGEYGRALYWSDIAKDVLGRLPSHYRARCEDWRARAA